MNRSGKAVKCVAPLILLLMFGLAVHSLKQKSPTFDEQGFIVRGLGYLRGENRHMRVGHPLGLNALNASLLTWDERIALPSADPSWQETSFHRPAELFLWEIGNDVELIMFLARVPTVWLGMILAAVGARWTMEITRRRTVGLLALTLLALDPNILAHTRLTTTDLGITAAATLAGFGLWRYLVRPSFPHALLAAVTFALLQNTKFTAGLFVPLFAVVILGAWLHEISYARSFAPLKKHLPFIVIFPLVSLLTLWAMYGFQIGTLPESLPALSVLGGRTLPLAHHLEQLLDIGNRSTKGASAFLLGNYSQTGWWYYFPVAFALKTPLVTLATIIIGLIAACVSGIAIPETSSRQTATWLMLAAVPLGFFAISTFTGVNLGYRLILPTLPFLIIGGVSGLFAAVSTYKQNKPNLNVSFPQRRPSRGSSSPSRS